ncbi:hypothetical protein AX17_005797 [Amanita inopinata Kibby_2008]|nr:hypothetical protein AX17_005797 [Amanita inopinata Kibby_2008]
MTASDASAFQVRDSGDNTHQDGAFQSPEGNSTLSSSTPEPNLHSELEQSQRHDTELDPQVTALHAMFPDYDNALLESVLHSVSGDQNRAIDALLGMSDPQYKSEAHDENAAPSQVDLDEQLARRLMLEDQERQLPYQPYNGSLRRARSQQPQAARINERDTMTELQEQISRFAETGKKTLEGLVSKVKAKMQDFDRPSTSESSNQPSWTDAARVTNQRQSYHASNYYQPSYYDANPPAIPPSSTPIKKPVPSPGPIQGYDMTPEVDTAKVELSKPAPESLPDTTTPRSSIGVRQAAPIDGGKLGLLPKRPVSLLKPQSPADGHEVSQKTPTDDGDGLEYAENPFEDSRK